MEATKEVCESIDRLISYARARLGLSARNEVYVRNTVLDLVGLDSYDGDGKDYEGRSVSQLLRELVEACERAGLPAAEAPERLTDSVMGALMLSPEAVEEAFAAHMALSSEEATQWLYSYSVLSDYVKKEKLDANPRFTADNGLGYGRMMVSVPKKLFKRAVRRNIIKRRIRESYRLQKGILPEGAGADMLFIYNSKEIAESGEIFAAVRAILKDIGHEIRKSKGDS